MVLRSLLKFLKPRTFKLEAITSRLEAIASSLEAMLLGLG